MTRTSPSYSAFDGFNDDEVDRFLAGKATPEEAERFRAYLARNPETSAWLSMFREMERTFQAELESGAAEARVARRLGAFPTVDAPGSVREEDSTNALRTRRLSGGTSARTGELRRYLVAAALLIGAAGGYSVWRNANRPATESMRVAVAPPKVFSAARGQRAEIRLTDGTNVVLAADSKLTVPADFDSTGRTVTLTGEAYFDVFHNEGKPFTVRVGDVVVRDIGTRFDVRSYAADSAVRVLVTHGEVQLRHAAVMPNASGRVLRAGQLTYMNAEGRMSAVQSVDTMRYVAWTHGSLDFVGTPMRDIAVEIGRWYDVDIHFSDPSLAARKLTATIQDQSLSYVLDQLSVSLDARVVRRGRTITLIPNHS
jgi:ferric-dicitrate binding protein FerR (iron transport regulator)